MFIERVLTTNVLDGGAGADEFLRSDGLALLVAERLLVQVEEHGHDVRADGDAVAPVAVVRQCRVDVHQGSLPATAPSRSSCGVSSASRSSVTRPNSSP